MVKYVLHYFWRRQGRAESIRLAFKLAGVDFEEKAIKLVQWPQLKSTYPTRQMPQLEVNGKMIGQSKAILRYLAKEFGLYGKTSLEAAYIDQVIDTVEDIWAPIKPLFNGTLEEKAARRKKHVNEVVPSVCTSLEQLLALDVAGKFFVGNSITAADLFFFTAVDFVYFISEPGANSLVKFPKLAALKSRIAANPKIAERVAMRPPEFDEGAEV